MSEANEQVRVNEDEKAWETIIDDAFNKEESLIPMTVRFTSKANEAFQAIADENHVSKAEVVRVAAAGGMERYFGNVRYIDTKQAEVINKNICILASELAEIKSQIRRIGVNFNQEIKLKHIEKQLKEFDVNSSDGDYGSAIQKRLNNRDKIKKLEEEADAIRSNESLLNKKELEHLMTRFEEATKKVSEALWHMQG